jgi:putative addiction module component (TIGR02574 family)
MDILVEKELFLKRFERITDVELIKVLNAFLDYALSNQRILDSKQEKNAKDYELSEEHKQILNERLAYYKSNKDKLISWEDVKKRIK